MQRAWHGRGSVLFGFILSALVVIACWAAIPPEPPGAAVSGGDGASRPATPTGQVSPTDSSAVEPELNLSGRPTAENPLIGREAFLDRKHTSRQATALLESQQPSTASQTTAIGTGIACIADSNCQPRFCDSSVHCVWGGFCDGTMLLTDCYCDGGQCRCNGSRECNDGLFCNGTEVCDAQHGTCTTPNGQPCVAGSTCDEARDVCARACQTDAQCPVPGCYGNRFVAASHCNNGQCQWAEQECDDGQFCNGKEACDASHGGCIPAPTGVPCRSFEVCDANGKVCTLRADRTIYVDTLDFQEHFVADAGSPMFPVPQTSLLDAGDLAYRYGGYLTIKFAVEGEIVTDSGVAGAAHVILDGENKITLRGMPDSSWTLDWWSWDTTVKNLRVIGPGVGAGAYGGVETGSNATLVNLYIDGFEHGIYLSEGNNVVSNCVVTNCLIAFQSECASGEVANCRFDAIVKGLQLYEYCEEPMHIHDCVISMTDGMIPEDYQRVHRIGIASVYAWDVAGDVIGPNNIITGFATAGIWCETDGNYIFGNQIESNGIGIWFDTTQQYNVVGLDPQGGDAPNIIRDNASDGILIGEGCVATIRYNSIAHNGGLGIAKTGYPYPPTFEVDRTNGTVKGFAAVPDDSLVDVYVDPEDEGESYLGTTVVHDCAFDWPGDIPEGNVTATATDTVINATSAFAPWLRLEVVDLNTPRFIQPGGTITTDANILAQGGRTVVGFAADGVTPILLRFVSSLPNPPPLKILSRNAESFTPPFCGVRRGRT